jgi:hypothetical protein
MYIIEINYVWKLANHFHENQETITLPEIEDIEHNTDVSDAYYPDPDGGYDQPMRSVVSFDPDGSENNSVTHTCSGQVLMNTDVEPSTGGWHIVEYGQFYVYSAFLDPLLKRNSLIHVVSIMSYQTEVYCQLWTRGRLVDIIKTKPKLLGIVGPRRRATRLGLNRPPLR